MSRRRIIWILAAVTCVPAATMLGLGWQILEQDRRLERQYRQDLRQQAADRAVRALQAALSDPDLLRTPPGGSALLLSFPDGARMYRAQAPQLPDAPAGLFRDPEALENAGNLPGAAKAYQILTRSADQAVQAGAWMRLARTLRKQHDASGALAAYDTLARYAGFAAGEYPAGLTSAWGRCAIFADLGRHSDLKQAAGLLRQGLIEGRWPISQAVYDIFMDDAAEWSGGTRPRDRELLTEAANQLWEQIATRALPSEGQRLLMVRGEPVTLVWKGPAVLAALKPFLTSRWLAKAGPGVWLRDEDGHDLTPAQSADFLMRHPYETRLPWVVAVAAPDAAQVFAVRRRLLLVLLGVVALFTAAGGWFCLRAMRQEFALSRMQSDFVAAVSHEFRTPLTSMKLITEALEDGRIPDTGRLQDSYHALARATGRLHRLVEDLLDFRRMESGAVEYRMRPLDAAAAVRSVAEDFRREVEDRGFRVRAQVEDGVLINADEGAISRALWNLLDNAAKYSGDSRDIDLSLARRDARVQFSVTDRGMGIAPEEKAHLFSKFYRGENAKRSGIRGTGIGLAMVAQIAAAHGGQVSVESEPGHGSTFTMTLPEEAR